MQSLSIDLGYKKVQDYSMAYLDQMYPHVDNGGSCDVCRIVDQLILNNLTLPFVGDSMTRQTVAGLHCTLLRRVRGRCEQ
jgi:hypothetical protein